MRFTQHPTNNHVLGAPAGHDQSQLEVGALPCTVHLHTTTNEPMITSYWEPTEEDRRAIAQGKKIALTVYGRWHPVVSMSVEE